MPSKLPKQSRFPLAFPHHGKKLGLTPREEEVIHWVAQGKTNGEIGRILEISQRTVSKHLENINRKIGTKSKTEAVVHFFVRPQQSLPVRVVNPADFASWVSLAPLGQAGPPLWQTRRHA